MKKLLIVAAAAVVALAFTYKVQVVKPVFILEDRCGKAVALAERTPVHKLKYFLPALPHDILRTEMHRHSFVRSVIQEQKGVGFRLFHQTA